MIKNNYSHPVDMPKLESPFYREEINGNYVVTPKVNFDYHWVFDEPAVEAVEKLDGTNVSIVIEKGKVKQKVILYLGNALHIKDVFEFYNLNYKT